MLAYILRRLLLMIPTILGIMAVSFGIVQFVPGGPVERAIAQLQGTDQSSTAGFGGGGGQIGAGAAQAGGDISSRYRGSQGLDPKFIKELEKQYGFDKPALAGSIKPPNSIVAAAIAAAHSRLGVPYVWGATGPDQFDCSGLTQWSYAHAGITLPRTAAEQWNAGPHPALSSLLPGDLLFWATDTSNPATIHHVAMYIGHGLMIAAPHTGENVQIQPVYMDGFIGAMRPWANAVTQLPEPVVGGG